MTEKRQISRIASWLESHPTIKIMTISGALLTFLFDIGYTYIHIRPLQEEERRARFWEVIARPAPGNSGKIQAMEYLSKQGVPLHGTNLSCERHQGEWKNIKTRLFSFEIRECIGGVYLQNAFLPGADLSTANLRGALLDGSVLTGANLDSANLRGARVAHAGLRQASLTNITANMADFSYADFTEGNLVGANLFSSRLLGAKLQSANMNAINLGNAGLLGADLKGADLTDGQLGYANFRAADLTNAKLEGADLDKADLSYANVSAADFRGVKDLTQDQLDQAWAWKDTPALNLPDGVKISRLCDPGADNSRRTDFETQLAAGEIISANLDYCGIQADPTVSTLPDDLKEFAGLMKTGARGGGN